MFYWKVLLVCAALFCDLSLGQQNNLVKIGLIDSNGKETVTYIPSPYLANCPLDGKIPQAGGSVSLRVESAPDCLTEALQDYANDLRNALIEVVKELEQAEKNVNQATNNNAGLSLQPVIDLLEGVLKPLNLDGVTGILDLSQTVNSLQPVLGTVGETLVNLQTVLGSVTDSLGPLTLGVNGLLGGVGGLVAGVGGLVSGLGQTLSAVGAGLASGVLSDTLGALTGTVNGVLGNTLNNIPLNGLTDSLGKTVNGLTNTVGGLLDGKRR